MAKEPEPQAHIMGGAESRSNHEPSAEFFQNLSLADIYGHYPLDRSMIITDLPYGRTISDEQKKELIDRYGLYSIAAYSNKVVRAGEQARLVIDPGPTEKLSWWAPHHAERELLLKVAQGLSDPGRTPFILEAGCGTGFLSKVIAAANTTTVLGVDVDVAALNRLPVADSNVSLRVANVWDILDEFGPKYPNGIDKEVRENLQHTRKILDRFSWSLERRSWSEQEWSEYRRNCRLAKLGTRRLQEIVPKYESPSQVDMVISSFMNDGTELTIPIRDGLHPKCIVYIKAISGKGAKTGMGMNRYSGNYDESFIGRNLMVSSDPGEHYRTIAHWETFSELDYGYHMYGHSIELPIEVVVQLHRDVNLRDTAGSNLTVREYPWDSELTDVLRRHNKEDNFLSGIAQARRDLI